MNHPGGHLVALPDGSLQGPDGSTYRRTPRRLKRKDADAHLQAGAPLVTSVYPEGLTWHAPGAAATATWAEIAPRLVVGRKPPVRDLQWTGHLWQSEDGRPLLVFDGQH